MVEVVHAMTPMTFGSRERLGIELTLHGADAERDIGLAWGTGMLWLAGEPLWFWETDDGPKPIEWTWIDLLEFLADSWVRLVAEETYPFQMRPSSPSKLRAAAERHWEFDGISRRRQLEEDEILCRFEVHHDLARGMKGIDLPSIFLMREGEFIWVCSDANPYRFRFREIIDDLSLCGDFLAGHISPSGNPHATEVRNNWATRNHVDPILIRSYRTGMKPRTVDELESCLRRRLRTTQASAMLLEVPANDVFATSELLAVARMTNGNIPNLDLQAAVLAQIKGIPRVETPELDELGKEAASNIDAEKEPYEQGYEVARWLRRRLGFEKGRIEPREILSRWSVSVIDFQLPVRGREAVDAVACWGPRHGPVVMLNPYGQHSQTLQGARATLAHEIAHLLLDRNGSLPLAEVVGGNVPEMPEKRARAFAAEFLLPQEAVEQVVRSCPSIDEAVQRLRDDYFVSHHIVRYQVENSLAWDSLNDMQRDLVKALTDESVDFSGKRETVFKPHPAWSRTFVDFLKDGPAPDLDIERNQPAELERKDIEL